jgi:hypothetical protein
MIYGACLFKCFQAVKYDITAAYSNNGGGYVVALIITDVTSIKIAIIIKT